jgi:hypothetical protein
LSQRVAGIDRRASFKISETDLINVRYAGWSRLSANGLPLPCLTHSDMEFAAALFLPPQFRMYDALAEDDPLFGISARGTWQRTVIFWLHKLFFEGGNER